MKIRRLSEIDLARFAALPVGEPLERALRLYNAGGGVWSYDPVRESKADILAARTPLLGESAPISWPKIADQIARGRPDCAGMYQRGNPDARERWGWKGIIRRGASSGLVGCQIKYGAIVNRLWRERPLLERRCDRRPRWTIHPIL
jgi:hypothetical protein